MKRLNRIALLPIGILLAVSPAAGQQGADGVVVRAALDTLLTALHHRGWFDGALIAGRGDTVLYARGFGYANREAGAPFTPRTPSDGASLAKTFTAAAVLMLQEDGVLALGDPVQLHLPEYPYPGTTVGHLITHRAGGTPDYDYFFERIGPDELLTNERLLAVLRDHAPPLRHAPGERFSYDNRAFDLAALIVERVAGRPFEAFLRGRVFAPLGMDSVFARPARLSDWPGLRTMSYRREGDSLAVFDVWDREGFHGGSNLYFSADDLYRWVTSFHTRPLLGPAALDAGLGPVALNDGRETGLALLSWYPDVARRRFHYSGVLQGFYSVGYWDAERALSFAFVTNSNMPQEIRPRLTAAVAEILTTGNTEPIVMPEGAPLGEDYVDAVAGAYAVDGLGTLRLSAADGVLVVRVADGVAYAAFQGDPQTLYVPGLDAWLSFDEREGGRFRRVRWTTVFNRFTGERVE